MTSLRFPFPHLPNPPSNPNPPPPMSLRSSAAAAAVALSVGLGAGLVAFSSDNPNPSLFKPTWASHWPLWACLSLSGGPPPVVERRTGAEFPPVIDGSRRLLGVGVRRKSVFGLKNVDVYAFGVYADDSDVKGLNEKYGTSSVSELKENKDFYADIFDQDLRMTIRLQIVYGRLSIRSVRSAFEESVGSRLQRLSGSENKELLQRFTSLFRDEYKLPRGSIIEMSRERDHILHTRIDGKELGAIQSKLLCQSILDLYIGDDPFDRRAKEDIELGLASLLQK
ncbi:Fatty-acid-binding protein 1 [Acorus gramineus]|uniref:Chalcone--flavanone isomerase n=1 Tax=Acorus gramineus TaxID=55184 RepID=A0AAV9ATB3_ACOGR|nr:Fatty-acid-binding protein 1 [Acorus gramineus]